MRFVVFGTALAFLGGSLAAQDCVTFSGPEFARLLNPPTGVAPGTVTGLVRQPDGSYTAITGPVTQPFTFLGSEPNFQNYIGGCTAPPPGAQIPAISLTAPALGTASQVVVFAPFGSSGATLPGAAFTGTSSPVDYIRVGVLKGSSATITDPSVPEGAVSVAAADFNHDGVLDLAVVYTGSGSTPGGVAILLGAGNGTFEDAVSFPAGPNSLHATVADFNGDGNLDLAVAADSGTVTIFLGNGNGTFGTGTPISLTSRGPAAVIAADFNGDGLLDLATADEDGTVAIMLGHGDGTFGGPTFFNAGSDCAYLAAADFNNDGKLDIVATNFAAGVVAVLLGKGDGTFGMPVFYNSTYAPTGLIITDFNNDGKLDIVVGSGTPEVITPNFGSGEISVLLGNGDGTFQGGLYQVGATPKWIAAGDLNGDGKPDLVTVNPGTNSLTVLLNQGAGTFQYLNAYFPSPPPNGFVPASVTLTDLNGDGKLDMAIANPASVDVAIALGKGDGTFGAASYYQTDQGAAMVAAGDLNGDGVPDLVVANMGNVTSTNGKNTGDVSILLGSGGGAFHGATNVTAGVQPAFVFLQDLNGDGKLDLIVLNLGVTEGFSVATNPGGVSVFLGKGDGTFQPPVSYTAGTNPTAMAVGDLNGDGKVDLAVATNVSSNGPVIAILLGNGDGTFRTGSVLQSQSGVTNIAISDLNGDGKPDLVASACCGDTQMSYLLGNGDGTFQTQVLFNGGPSPAFFAVADLNGDGKPDLAIADQGSTGNGFATVLLNTSAALESGAFQVKSATVGQIEPFAAQSIVAAYGNNLATVTMSATAPLGTSLGGTTVTVTDSAGTARLASLFYVSPTQINFEIPAGTALGAATVTVQSQGVASQMAMIQIGTVSPGLFELNTSGLVAAYVLPVVGGKQQPLVLPTSPINVVNQQVYLEMYGTGIRNAALQDVTATVGGVSVPVIFEGAAPVYAGLDQVNIGPLPVSLAGRGSVDIVLTVEGQTANTVNVPIQ